MYDWHIREQVKNILNQSCFKTTEWNVTGRSTCSVNHLQLTLFVVSRKTRVSKMNIAESGISAQISLIESTQRKKSKVHSKSVMSIFTAEIDRSINWNSHCQWQMGQKYNFTLHVDFSVLSRANYWPKRKDQIWARYPAPKIRTLNKRVKVYD